MKDKPMLTDPPHEILEILEQVMLGRKTCRKAWRDIDAIYCPDPNPERVVTQKLLNDLATILRVAGAPLSDDGDLAPVMEWAERIGKVNHPGCPPFSSDKLGHPAGFPPRPMIIHDQNGSAKNP